MKVKIMMIRKTDNYATDDYDGNTTRRSANSPLSPRTKISRLYKHLKARENPGDFPRPPAHPEPRGGRPPLKTARPAPTVGTKAAAAPMDNGGRGA